MQRYKSIIDGSDLPQTIKVALSILNPQTLDELDDAYYELIHFLQHKDYYDVLDRIEKGEAFKAQQTDPAMIAKCNARLNELAIQLEALMPKGEAI